VTDSTELLVLRLALIAIIFVFVAAVALSLRTGSLPRSAVARASRPAVRWKLVVLRPGETGLQPGTEFALAGQMLVGRDERAGIVLADASVSTRHASIERTDHGWRVLDLGSTNGTFINGRQLGPKGATVRGREKLTFGNVVLQLSSE
jgi:hypothetical protein